LHIKAIHDETHGGYGCLRTWKELLARDIRLGKERALQAHATAWHTRQGHAPLQGHHRQQP
jgi:hypothetical protein